MTDGPNGGEVPIPDHTPEQAFAREAVTEGVEVAAEDAVGRAEAESREAAIDEQAKKDLITILNDAMPGLKAEEREGIASTVVELRGVEEIEEQDQADSIARRLSKLNKYEAEQLLNYTNLSPESKQKILRNFEEMSAEERAEAERKDHEMSETEAGAKGRVADTMRDEADRAAQRANDAIDQAAANGDIDEDKKDELKAKVAGFHTRITDLFAPGEPGRVWSKRVGKTLYYAMLTAIVVLLLEMNIIYKATSRSGRRSQ